MMAGEKISKNTVMLIAIAINFVRSLFYLLQLSKFPFKRHIVFRKVK